MENECASLVWENQNQKQGWRCSACGAFYERDRSWEPPIWECMKCHVHWGFAKIKTEKENQNA